MQFPSFRPAEAVEAVVPLGVNATEPAESAAQLRAAVARLESELVAGQRLVALGQMSAMIAHEINNLMTSVLGRADFALQTGRPEDMRKALERSRAQVQQAIAVTRRLLSFARPEEDPIAGCGLAAAVRAALETATRPLEKDQIELKLAVPDDLWVRAPRELLVQVLLNLILNARQAMQGRPGRLSITARRDGAHMVIDVADTGTGIPPEHLANVINPFLAAADRQPGPSVGLGLSVCRIIVRRYGATLEGLSNEDHGCTFRLRWPGGREN